jgi:hypothetical protein
MASFRDFIGGKYQAAKNFSQKKIKGKITKAGPESITDRDGDENTQIIIYLNNWDKGFSMGVGNCERLAKKWGEDVDKWVGKIVELKVVDKEAFGEPCKGFEATPIGSK